MKKLIIAIALFAAGTTAQAQTNLKFGWINSTELLDVMPEKKKAAATLDSLVKVEENIIKLLNDAYEKKAKDIEMNGSKMTPENLKKAEDELNKIEEGIYIQTQTSRDKISTKEKELVDPILDKISETIKTVGKEEGYTYIFDISLNQLLVYPDGDNVLKSVKKKLGLPVMD